MVAGLGAQGSFVAMNNTVSQSVPHLHCHVVPRTAATACAGSSGRARGTPRRRRRMPRGCGPRSSTTRSIRR
ncbi:MAG: hypothetical protein R2734_20785 [Nocardioides sp.]